jgi:hypothetical protein
MKAQGELPVLDDFAVSIVRCEKKYLGLFVLTKLNTIVHFRLP